MRLATSDASTYEEDDTARIAYDRSRRVRARLRRPAAAGRAAGRGRRGAAEADQRRAGPAGRDRRGAAAAAQRERRHGDDDRLPGDDAAGRAHRRGRSRRRARRPCHRSREQTGTRVSIGGATATNLDFSEHDPRQAAAVHRRRRRAIAAAARGRLPLAADPGQGRHLQPAVDRGRVRRRDADLPGRTPRGPVRRRDRADRVVPADHGLRRRVRPVDGLRGVPRLAHARGVGAHEGTRATRCSTASR